MCVRHIIGEGGGGSLLLTLAPGRGKFMNAPVNPEGWPGLQMTVLFFKSCKNDNAYFVLYRHCRPRLAFAICYEMRLCFINLRDERKKRVSAIDDKISGDTSP